MKLLLVEDDEFKRKKVLRLLEVEFPSLAVYSARSISSSMQLLERHSDIAVVILDMSLPTFDVGPGESGGRPQGFGGLSVIQHLDAMESTAKVVVLTQFLQFGEEEESMDIGDLEDLLKRDYSDQFFSLVRYGAGSENWKHELGQALRDVVEDK